MNNRKDLFFLVASSSLVPLSYFVFPFLCGFFNLSQGCLMLLAPILLFGPVVAGIFVAMQLPVTSKLSRVSIGVATWAVTVAVFFLFPAAAKTWTLGFAANFRLIKDPAQIQKWAVGVLDRYEVEQISTSTNAPYWAVGKEKLKDSEIPSRIAALWQNKPSIGIVTMTSDGSIGDSFHTRPTGDGSSSATENYTHCVAFSWYLTGILVGRPNFRSTWNPWYIHEIMPGVYAYSGMK